VKVDQVLRSDEFCAGQQSAPAISFHMSYEPYEALIAPARSKASILRLIFGIVITALLYMLLLRVSWQLLLQVSGATWFEQTMQVPGPSSPSQMFILLGSFGFMTCSSQFHRMVPTSPQPARAYRRFRPARKGNFSDPQESYSL
jgi:hypothetical protein